MKINKQVRRFDLGELRASSRTPQGFLKCPGFATRVGVFPYMDGNGKVRRELRHPDDVFDKESMETLKYAPVTIEHPPEMITPSNVALYSVGHTTERVEKKTDKLDTDLIIEQEKGIDAVEKEGIRELSCGYTADIVEESGDFNGAPYDFRQINIRYNHLAMVKRGRAGPEVRMRLDSMDAVMQISKPVAGEFTQESAVDSEPRLGAEEQNAVGEPNLKSIVIAGQEVELPSDVADTVQDYLDRFDEMRAKLAQLEEEMAKRNDEDVGQKGISPQVKVEQQGPDGRAAPGKTKAAPGTITGGPAGKADEDVHAGVGGLHANSQAKGGKELADEDMEEKDDAEKEEKEHDDYEGSSAAAGGGHAEDPIARMKQDMEAMKAKLDNYASMSMGKDEKRGDRKDSSQAQVRARVKLERTAEKLVPFEVAQKFDGMSDDEIRSAVIKHKAPNADLEGKSTIYLQSRFDHLCEMLEEDSSSEFRKEAGRHMLGAARTDGVKEDKYDADPAQARIKMITSGREEYKSSLSASKK